VRSEFKSRFNATLALCLVLAGALVVRVAYIQFWNNPRLEQISKRQFQSKVLIRPRRGTITDRNGEPLAVNLETNSLAANPLKVENRRMLARLLAKASDIPIAKLMQRLSEKKEFVWIKRHLTESEMNRLKKFRIIDGDDDLVPGLWLVKESQRVYPHGELAAHTLGDVNTDEDGVEGVELWMNEKMRGKVTSVSAIKDALGRPSFMDTVAAKHAREGETVELTLDASLQFAVEELLRDSVTKHGARSGSVIVMNAANGEILALANQPAFNPNDKSIPADKRRNRALTDGYEPGSTMKAVLIASALSHGWKLGDQVYGEHGQFKVQGKRISEAEAKEAFEWLTLKQIIQLSSNVGAAKVALKLGADNYISTLKAFGFGAKTDTGFPGEISGRIPARKEWQPLSLANIGFGQGILVTPIQMIRAYATFLNGGYLVQPSLLKNTSVNTIELGPKRIISEKVAQDVVSALETVTEENGTGVKAAVPGYIVAGKTGTAQMIDPSTGKYSRSNHISSFIGFAVGVQPQIVIFTSLDDPKGVYFAAETAAPLFHDVLTAVATRFSLPARAVQLANAKSSRQPVHADSLKTSQAVPAVDMPHTLQWQGTTPSGAMIWMTPLVRGLSAREVMEVLQGHGFNLDVHGDGVVRIQSPEAGKPLVEGETIRITLGEP
jgi:cell division protein FtsI (penicillin-binding protein 3)